MVRFYTKETGIDVEMSQKNHQIKLITENIEQGNDERALRLISSDEMDKETINLRGPYQSQLIHTASKYGRDVILKKLIEKGADIHSLDYVTLYNFN